jgi:hypothetical protein
MYVNLVKEEFIKYWTLLNPLQKQSLMTFILSFSEEEKSNIKAAMNELQEPGEEYNVPWEIFKELSKQQKKALIAFLESFGIEPALRLNIEQYNQEIDEAMVRMDAGEGILHEEVVGMLKARFSGK